MGLGQSDSSYCFTQEQVKTFLRTKVELTQCLESNEILLNENSSLTDTIGVLESDNTKTKRKLRRTRVIASGGILGTILFGVLAFLF